MEQQSDFHLPVQVADWRTGHAEVPVTGATVIGLLAELRLQNFQRQISRRAEDFTQPQAIAGRC